MAIKFHMSCGSAYKLANELKVNPDTCGRTNSIWIRYVWTWKFWNPQRKTCGLIQKYPDTCGRGLGRCVALWIIPIHNFTHIPYTVLNVKNSLTFPRLSTDLSKVFTNLTFIKEKKSMLTFALVFFAGHRYFSLHFQPSGVECQTDCFACFVAYFSSFPKENAFQSLKENLWTINRKTEFPDFSLTLTNFVFPWLFPDRGNSAYCWETYSALRNTTSLTLNIVMETLIACIFKEIRNVLSWQVNCFWMLRAWCDKNMTHRYLITKMPRLCIRKESCYD